MNQEQEFADFVAANRNRLMRYARKFSFVGEDPEDLLQSALVKAWRSLPAFRRECSYAAWTACIVRSLALQNARSAARRRSIAAVVPFPERFDAIDERLHIERDAIDASALRAVRRAVHTFTPALQAAFHEMLSEIPRSSAVSHITRKVRQCRLKQALIEHFRGLSGEMAVPHETEEAAQIRPGGTGTVSAAPSHVVTLSDPMWAGAAELKAGDYHLEVKDGKAVFVEPPEEAKTAGRKYNFTSVVTDSADGRPKLAETDAGGAKIRVIFEPAAGARAAK